MASRDEFDDFLDDDDDAPIVDTRADGRLLKVPLARISPNKVNPRTDFGTKAELEDLGKSLKRRQNQAIPVVTKGAYLKLWPEHSQDIGNVDVVIVSGERRFRGASAVALPALNCVVNDDFAADRKTFMEAVVSENVDRQNFDAVEEAYAVQALVTEFGTNRAVAQHFERADGWVTQRILLTHLAPELQKMVRNKAIPLEFARNLGKLARDNEWSAEEQAEWWTAKRSELMEQSKGRKAEKKAAKQKPPPEAPSPAPKQPELSSQPAGQGEGGEEAPGASSQTPPPATPATPATPKPLGFTAVKPSAAGGSQETESVQPDTGEQETEEASVPSLPWHNVAAMLRILREHMDPADFERLVKEGLEVI